MTRITKFRKNGVCALTRLCIAFAEDRPLIGDEQSDHLEMDGRSDLVIGTGELEMQIEE